MKSLKTIYIGIFIFFFLTLSFYFILGGFDPVEIRFFNGTTRTVIGREYVLPDGNKYFQQQMDSLKTSLLEKNLSGILTAVVYQNEDLKDSIRYFLGAAQDSTKGVPRVPAGFDYRQYHTDRVYRIFVKQSNWTHPTPEKIEELMNAESIKEGETLEPYTFELYYEDGSFSIEKWVK